MKTLHLLIALCSICMLSCSKKNNDVYIEGNIPQVKSGMVYLTDAYKWMIKIDSTEIVNGKFSLHIKNTSSFSPFLGSLYFTDASDPKPGMFLFTSSSTSGFFVEPGKTIITGQSLNKDGPRYQNLTATVKSGKQNAVFENNRTLGYINDKDSAIRVGKISWFIKKIKDAPYSYYLLDNIYNFRTSYSKKELAAFFESFDEDVKKSSAGEKFMAYLRLKRDGNKYTNYALTTSTNSLLPIINQECDLNMLIFWASWCKPCREEIPLLKNIFAKFKSPRFNMVSISIDKEEDNWKKALKQENMPWVQCITREIDKDIESSYDLGGVPLVIFTDKNGNEIKRFLGSSENDEKEFEKIISAVVMK